MAIRKDANTLTSAERQEYVSAVLTLKAEGIYNQFVLRHANANMMAIHRCPAFLPWHRRFIWDFERELQRVSGNPDLGLPYWNWPEGDENASMWQSNFLGGNGVNGNGAVTSGPFRQGQWTVINRSGLPAGPLERAFGTGGFDSLPTLSEIEDVMTITPYDTFPWNRSSVSSFRNQMEGWDGPNLHNRGHVWVMGSMFPMTSPNDPVFFMHHCMVDKLWHEWQLRNPNHGYLPMSNGAFGQNLNDPMDSTPNGPIGNRPIDVLDSAALDIQYDSLLPETIRIIATVPPSEQTLVLNSGGVNGRVGSAGEVDVYNFEATTFGQYTIETSGTSDTVIALYGPDDPSNQLAINDDGGLNFNSLIQMNLSAGKYIVRVRLYNGNDTGDYKIGVTFVAAPAIEELIVDAPMVNVAISAASESDLYRFQVQNQGNYVIETNGPTDTFLTLFGPDSQSIQIAENDDSGPSLNSRISQTLDSGEYFARVRHYSMFGTGPYQIHVQRE